MMGNESSDMISYPLVIVIMCITCTIKEVYTLFHFHDLDLGSQGQLRSNVMMGNESSDMISYLSVIVTVGLRCTS